MLFITYVVSLIYVWIASKSLVSVLTIHVEFVVVFALIYFFFDFLLILLSPLILVLGPIQKIITSQYIKKFKQNVPAEVVIILGYPNWLTLEGWLKPIFLKGEIKALVKYLTVKKQDFSFYPKATLMDVENNEQSKNQRSIFLLVMEVLMNFNWERTLSFIIAI